MSSNLEIPKDATETWSSSAQDGSDREEPKFDRYECDSDEERLNAQSDDIQHVMVPASPDRVCPPPPRHRRIRRVLPANHRSAQTERSIHDE